MATNLHPTPMSVEEMTEDQEDEILAEIAIESLESGIVSPGVFVWLQ